MELLHTIPPFFDEHSEILILGSFPSVKSREAGFFYGHPQNRFWKVTSTVCGCSEPHTIDEKKTFLRSQHIALWDTIASCTVEGSADGTIKNIKPNDLSGILGACGIERIFVNGKTAEKIYNRYILPKIGREAIYLPSTSPANAAFSPEKLFDAWRVIMKGE